MPSIANSRKPYAGTHRALVLALDVGTTFSGVSYAFLEPGNVPKIHGVTRYPGQEHVAGNSKIPSILYYDAQGNVMAAGAEAETTQIVSQAEDEEWTKVELFKLRLRPRTMKLDMNGMNFGVLPAGKSAEDVFGDFLRYLFRCTRKFIEDTHANGKKLWKAVEKDIFFVLSHPNGWEGPQQTRMRRSAIIGGLIPNTDEGKARIRFVTEGEASMHACILSGLAADVLSDGNGFIVADAGGGTLDVSSYVLRGTSPIVIEEVAPPDCVFSGAVFVSRRCRVFLEEKLKASKYGSPDTLDHITKRFDETTKRLFRNKDELQFIPFGSPLDKDLKAGIRGGQLKLSGAEVAELFEPSIQAAVASIRHQVEASRGVVKAVWLVGGFAASPWLFSQLQARLAPFGIPVNRPDTQTSKAVADGAIGFFCDHHVSARMSRYMYGVEYLREVNPDDQEHISRQNRILQMPSGPRLLPDAFDCILAKGIRVKESSVFSRKYYTEVTKLSTLSVFEIEIWCYRGGDTIPKWIDRHSDHFASLCHVRADLSKLSNSAEPKVGANRQTYWTVVFNIEIHFGLTEFKARIKWIEDNKVCYGPASIVYNEMGYRNEEDERSSIRDDESSSSRGRRSTHEQHIDSRSAPVSPTHSQPASSIHRSNSGQSSGSVSSSGYTAATSSRSDASRHSSSSSKGKSRVADGPIIPDLSGIPSAREYIAPSFQSPSSASVSRAGSIYSYRSSSSRPAEPSKLAPRAPTPTPPAPMSAGSSSSSTQPSVHSPYPSTPSTAVTSPALSPSVELQMSSIMFEIAKAEDKPKEYITSPPPSVSRAPSGTAGSASRHPPPPVTALVQTAVTPAPAATTAPVGSEAKLEVTATEAGADGKTEAASPALTSSNPEPVIPVQPTDTNKDMPKDAPAETAPATTVDASMEAPKGATPEASKVAAELAMDAQAPVAAPAAASVTPDAAASTTETTAAPSAKDTAAPAPTTVLLSALAATSESSAAAIAAEPAKTGAGAVQHPAAEPASHETDEGKREEGKDEGAIVKEDEQKQAASKPEKKDELKMPEEAANPTDVPSSISPSPEPTKAEASKPGDAQAPVEAEPKAKSESASAEPKSEKGDGKDSTPSESASTKADTAAAAPVAPSADLAATETPSKAADKAESAKPVVDASAAEEKEDSISNLKDSLKKVTGKKKKGKGKGGNTPSATPAVSRTPSKATSDGGEKTAGKGKTVSDNAIEKAPNEKSEADVKAPSDKPAPTIEDVKGDETTDQIKDESKAEKDERKDEAKIEHMNEKKEEPKEKKGSGWAILNTPIALTHIAPNKNSAKPAATKGKSGWGASWGLTGGWDIL